MKSLLPVAMALVLFGCGKETSAPEPSTTSAPDTQPVAAAPIAPTATQATATLPADSPIPAAGVLLWLRADDAVAGANNGKVQTWTNPLVPNATAQAVRADHLPAVVANAINGHAVIRFDGTDQTLMSNIDISPARTPEGTVIAVFTSTTAEASPLRKLYGDDNGGYDRAVGLDDRAAGKSYTAFTGNGVTGYFALTPNTTYITVDEYSPKEFSGWVNGTATLTKAAADWQDALPNLYIGGTGTVYNEFWSGDLAELIVYARKLSDTERAQVEDYLGQKYGMGMTRGPAAVGTAR